MGDKIVLRFTIEGLSEIHYKRAKVEITEKKHDYATIKKKEQKIYPFKYNYTSPLPEEEQLEIQYNPLKGVLTTAKNPEILKRTTAQLIENKFKAIIEEEQVDFDSLLAYEVKKWVSGINMKDKIQLSQIQNI